MCWFVDIFSQNFMSTFRGGLGSTTCARPYLFGRPDKFEFRLLLVFFALSTLNHCRLLFRVVRVYRDTFF